jgi:molybdopterin-guanine dinucleotide biosynthesis protein A
VPRHAAAQGGPQHGHQVEPLLAVYRQACLPSITGCLVRDERSMRAALRQIAVRYLDPAWWMRFDADGRSFLNPNRPDDLARAIELIDSASSLLALR